MIKKIRVYGDEVLRNKSQNVEKIDEKILNILDDMVETMEYAGGIGLAAPQIGINLNIFIILIDDVLRKVINPEIIESSDEKTEREEGCLSIPGIYKKVERPARIRVRYLNEKGEKVEEELDAMRARAFQHEFDHLNGVLYTDRLKPVSKKLVAGKLKKLQRSNKEND